MLKREAYLKIAAVIKTLPEQMTKRQLVLAFVDALRADRPAFDASKFKLACDYAAPVSVADPDRPIRTREQQRDFIRARYADKPDILTTQEVIWKAQDAGVAFEPQSKENDNHDDDDWLNET